MEITNDQLVKIYDQATVVANRAYVIQKFYCSDANVLFQQAMEKEIELGEEGIGSKKVEELKKMDKGPHTYKYPEGSIGRGEENTGVVNVKQLDSLLDPVNDEIKERAKELLPFAQTLLKEAGEDALKSLLKDNWKIPIYGDLSYIGRYEGMLKGKEDYWLYSAFGNGLFATHVKKLCRSVAEKRGFELEGVEELKFEEFIQRQMKKP